MWRSIPIRPASSIQVRSINYRGVEGPGTDSAYIGVMTMRSRPNGGLVARSRSTIWITGSSRFDRDGSDGNVARNQRLGGLAGQW